jgi:hypothetical protein
MIVCTIFDQMPNKSKCQGNHKSSIDKDLWAKIKIKKNLGRIVVVLTIPPLKASVVNMLFVRIMQKK